MDSLADLDTRLLVDLLRDHTNPRKSLGQHYLIDEEVIERSISLTREFSSPLSTDSHVLEVGPGSGSLTLELLRSDSDVTAIEIDKESVEHLNRVFAGRQCRLQIEEADAVSLTWPKGITHVISNLPYQISSPIIDRLSKYHSSNPIELSILLVQEEFAYKMAMFSAPYDVGPLGLNLWLDFDVSIDRRVPPSSFSPAPRVQSRLVVLKPVIRSEVKGTNKQMFRIITRHCFSNRRRKIRTLLSKTPSRISRVSGWHRDRWKNSISKLLSSKSTGIEEGWADKRPENLEPKDWISIVNAISSIQ